MSVSRALHYMAMAFIALLVFMALSLTLFWLGAISPETCELMGNIAFGIAGLVFLPIMLVCETIRIKGVKGR